MKTKILNIFLVILIAKSAAFGQVPMTFEEAAEWLVEIVSKYRCA